MNAINTVAAFALFNDIDNTNAGFAERALVLGITSRDECRPLAVQWASKKYGAPTKQGQRGIGFDTTTHKGNAAHQAVKRILSALFDHASTQPVKQAAQQDVVLKLAKAAEKLTAAQRRKLVRLISELG